MSERTTAEQVRICRRDLDTNLMVLEHKLTDLKRISIEGVTLWIEDLVARCQSARRDARALVDLTRPNPEPEPVPAVASAALDRRLGVGPTDAEMTDAAFQEALVEVFGSDRGAD